MRPRRSTAPSSSLRVALLAIAVAAALLGVVLYLTLDVGPANAPIAPLLLFLPVVFWGYVAAGLAAWWRRPRNRVGALLVWCGAAFWFVPAGNTTVPGLVALGAVFATLIAAALAHLLLAFPSGRLDSPWSRGIVIGLYVVACVLQAGQYLDSPVVAAIQTVAANTLLIAATAMLFVRFVRAGRGHRAALLPVYLVGAVVLLFVPLIAVVFTASGGDPVSRAVLQIVAIALVPAAVLLAFLRGGFRSALGLDELAGWMNDAGPARRPTQEAVADALGDPTLSVSFWSTERQGWVGADGEPVDTDGEPGRGSLELGSPDDPIALLRYDATLLRDEAEVRQAGGLVLLGIERERLTAELLAGRSALLDSRRRVVEAADAERRRLARDLHDGLQAQLVLLAIAAQRIAKAPSADVADRATELRGHIDAAAAELRALVHGLHPATLVEGGLLGSLAELCDRMPIRTSLHATGLSLVPDDVALTAYLITSEALANVVKHAGAHHVEVSATRSADRLVVEVRDDGCGGADATRGSGIRGVTDRVGALGGTVQFTSPPGRGTVLRVELPCA